MNHNELREVWKEKIRNKYGKQYVIKSIPKDYIHEGLNSSEFISHLIADIESLLSSQNTSYGQELHPNGIIPYLKFLRFSRNTSKSDSNGCEHGTYFNGNGTSVPCPICHKTSDTIGEVKKLLEKLMKEERYPYNNGLETIAISYNEAISDAIEALTNLEEKLNKGK